ncbi:MAG TPA: polysaccharide deacetylase family protein, partial [Acidobacteriota bacterium]|nr:polysaccharide deacetylase family protein [Acidobacteriota bacterium]
NIKAAGFIVEEKIDDDPQGYIVLEDWFREGHTLGNNTYGYVDFNEVSVKDFLAHVADGQKYLRQVTKVERPLDRYIRFPLLHEGDTASKKKDAAKRLYRGGYLIAPATVIPTDYEFNHVYHDVTDADDSDLMDQFKALYLEHLSACLDYAEEQSEIVFDRQIKHILRLHLGIATAILFEDTLGLLEKRGFEFVSMEEALKDPAYETEELYVGPLGLSFIDRVAATQGLAFNEEGCQISRREVRAKLRIQRK